MGAGTRESTETLGGTGPEQSLSQRDLRNYWAFIAWQISRELKCAATECGDVAPTFSRDDALSAHLWFTAPNFIAQSPGTALVMLSVKVPRPRGEL